MLPFHKNIKIFFLLILKERGSSSPHPGGDKEHGLCGLVDGIGGVSAGDLSLAGKSYKILCKLLTWFIC